MLSELKTAKKVIGLKQTKKALSEGGVKTVFVASDAERRLVAPVIEQCEKSGIEMVDTATMRELGEACGIEVGAAVAAIIGG